MCLMLYNVYISSYIVHALFTRLCVRALVCAHGRHTCDTRVLLHTSFIAMNAVYYCLMPYKAKSCERLTLLNSPLHPTPRFL